MIFGFAFVLWNYMLTSISNRNDFWDCWCCCCYVFHRFCFISIYWKQCMCRRHIFKSFTLATHFSHQNASNINEWKYHAASGSRWLRWIFEMVHHTKTNQTTEIFSITTYSMEQTGYEWHISSALKTHVQITNQRIDVYDFEKKEVGGQEILVHKSHLQAHAPHHCTPQSRRCNNDHRHQITAR